MLKLRTPPARARVAVTIGLLLALAPSVAGAETRSFYDTKGNGPSGGAGTEGPANTYPSTIAVAGVPGTVTGVRVTLFGFLSGNADDADVLLTGPNGAKVILLSDACGDLGVKDNVWTFDDAAPTFVSNNGPCPNGEQTFMPSNYSGNDGDADNFAVAGGPAAPYVNKLAALAGGSPNGDWKLFMLDDKPGVFGFGIGGWGLRLEVEPPPGTQNPAGATVPTNTTKPTTTGTPKSGRTLTCAPGSWTGLPAFAFGWLRNGDPIAGQTATTLKLRPRDVGKAVQCEVTATSAGGTAVEQSKPVVAKKARRGRRR